MRWRTRAVRGTPMRATVQTNRGLRRRIPGSAIFNLLFTRPIMSGPGNSLAS